MLLVTVGRISRVSGADSVGYGANTQVTASSGWYGLVRDRTEPTGGSGGLMAETGNAEGFHTALNQLRMAAGDPPPSYDKLIRQAAAQKPPINLTKQTLSDWFNGKAKIPKDVRAQDFVIAYLEALAKRHGSYRPRGVVWWRQLRAQRQTAPSDAPVLGHVISGLSEQDALVYEVHQAIAPDRTDTAVLPPYLERAFDAQLRWELEAADKAGGTEWGSRAIMLVGGSSTGKTRASWEAIRSVLPQWRVWHPLSPERPAAVVEALEYGRIAPRTVIWLNEAQLYLTSAGVGAEVASRLEQLLQGPGPVVVLGSMWPDDWETLTQKDSTSHTAARQLLRISVEITVPNGFSAADLGRNRQQIATDSRLRWAKQYGGALIAQHLAGVPQLRHRYERAREATRAVVWAAMDARRLSGWLRLPDAFLRRAAPGYLDPKVWDQTGAGDEWFEAAIATLTEECHGADGPLTLRKPLPGEPGRATVEYRLADYLEQLGRDERRGSYPPDSFWAAAIASCPDGVVLSDFGRRARSWGQLASARLLFEQAATLGDETASSELVRTREVQGELDAGRKVARDLVRTGRIFELLEMANRRVFGNNLGAVFLEAANGDEDEAGRLLEEAGRLANATARIAGN
jgi:hypothetical protein